MIKVYSLFSGSKGNSTLVDLDGKKILIDFGVSFISLKKRLAKFDLTENDIDGVVVTHAHSDHISGFMKDSPIRELPVYASKQVLQRLPDGMKKFEVEEEKPFSLFGFAVTPFAVPHDEFCFAYRFTNSETFSYATDLGVVSENTLKHLLSSDKIFIEANHDVNLLKAGSYPFLLKKRISGETGHLSNTACGETCKKLLSGGSKTFILGHLSEENNYPELAYLTVSEKLAEIKADAGKDYFLHVATKGGLKDII